MGRSAVVVVALVALACSKTPPPASSSSPEAAAAAAATLDGYRVEGCACVDLDCAVRVDDARAAWLVAEHGRVTFTDEQRLAAVATERAYQRCFATLREIDADRAVRELAALADEMCACTSKPCADAVAAKTTALGERHRDTKATAEQMAEAAAITETITKCLAWANGEAPSRPSPPVDASVPSPPEPSAALAVAQLDGFRARACACVDDECVAVVAAERHRWFAAALGRYLLGAEQRAAIDAHHQAFAACGGPRDPAVHQLLNDIRLRADEMCACTTSACVSATHARSAQWGKGVADRELGDELILRFLAHGARYSACRVRNTMDVDEAIRDIEAMRDAMCACTTKDCGDAVIAKMPELDERHKDTKTTEEVMTGAIAVFQQLATCMTRLGVTRQPR